VSSTTIYNVFKRNKLNKLPKSDKEKIIRPKRILMDHSGELLNVDLHQLSKGITLVNSNHTYYLLGLVDGYSRVAWVEVLESKKSLDVMFGFLKSFNLLRMEYGIESESVMTDNGSEFGGGSGTQDKEHHPFERLLLELGITHKYTKPYHPQQNGKVERFWKTLKEDFIEGSLYEDIVDLKDELLGFLVYYNEHRPHSSLGGLTPKEFLEKNNKNVTN
jgi:transposase InsO family protein